MGSFVPPSFEPLVREPAPKEHEKEEDAQDKKSRNWLGAVIWAYDNYSFADVWGSWVVSRPHPDNWAWHDKYWEPASFSAATWVGIDGSGKTPSEKSHDVLQAGVGHRCIVSTHQDTEYETYPWYEWYPEKPWQITGFQIAAGDLVNVDI